MYYTLPKLLQSFNRHSYPWLHILFLSASLLLSFTLVAIGILGSPVYFWGLVFLFRTCPECMYCVY